MYGGAEWDWQDDPALREDMRRADDEIMACEHCGEPGEEYIGQGTYCLECADRAGRNGYR